MNDLMKEKLKKYLENDCSEADLSSVMEFFTSPSERFHLDMQMKSTWKEMDLEGETPDLKGILHNIHYQVNRNEKPATRIRGVLNSLVKIAAILLLFLSVTLVYQLRRDHLAEAVTHTLSTPLASRTNFILPDGSVIWLNAGSSVTYPGRFTGESREVSISGEAYFDVVKGRTPFVVKTEGFSIEVLGTAFNLSAYPGEPGFVTLERGKVRIHREGVSGKYLLPGQQASIVQNSSEIAVRPVVTNIYTSWRENKLVFNDEALEDVAKRLERWYNIKILIKDESLNKTKINGKIEMESFSEVLELLELTVPLKYNYNKVTRVVTIEEKK
jgi:transmembrane sensor